jgi:D-alanyl-D-alanine carboxypeptidase (penicillin-binding protein 5/6)
VEQRHRWLVVVLVGVLLATGVPAAARTRRPGAVRDDLRVAPRGARRSEVPRWVAADSRALVAALEHLTAASAALMDTDTGALLYAKHARERRPPASTTKMMTALLVLEDGRLDERAVVTERAAAVAGAGLGLRRGQRIAVRDLLWAILLRSANDAAIVAAEHVAGSVEQFVARMNARATALGMEGTHFANPHGLDDPDHYSTAYDLALLARQALRHPIFASMVRAREARLSIYAGRNGGVARRRLLRTHNLLLDQFSGADGVKTGYTERAGRCLVASASRAGRQLIAVLLNDADRWTNAATLLEYGFAMLDGHAPRLRMFGESPGEVQKGEGG